MLLILVLLIGDRVSGSKSWIQIGGLLSFQPSEFAKIALVFIIAKFYSELGSYSKSYIIKYILGLGFFVLPFCIVFVSLLTSGGNTFKHSTWGVNFICNLSFEVVY